MTSRQQLRQPFWIFYFYRIALSPVIVGLLKLMRPLLRGKIRQIVDERSLSGWVYEKNPGSPLDRPFWIHAASGEIEYARPLIRELKKKFPKTAVVVTYSSPSARRILKNLTEVDAWGPSPWDLISNCQKFLMGLQPRAVFFARTDVWPELVTQARLQKIPSVLFSATFAENSSRLRGFSKFLTRWSLSQLDRIFVVSEDDLEILSRAGIQGAEIGGDTRFDQVFDRLQHPQPVFESLRPLPQERVFVAGSTWPEDEAVLLPWFINAQKNKPFRLLIAPHEINPERVESLVAEFRRHGIACDLYSSHRDWRNPVLILDQVGVLAELYRWGEVAFVGGSFKKQVHSVMEPLACGLPVAVGPFHKNNREALSFQKESVRGLPVVQVVTNTGDFERFWRNTAPFTNDDRFEIRQKIASYQGATRKLLDTLEANSL
jgi:3-deoxy-D-manno-octulosonic-acid transferase